MSYVLTLVRFDGIDDNLIEMVKRHVPFSRQEWLTDGIAIDLYTEETIEDETLNIVKTIAPKMDVFFQMVAGRRKKALFIDMDATLLAGETLDQVAKHVGIGDQITEITDRAMAGEIDFIDAFKQRIGLLKGTSASLFDQVYEDIPFTKGAALLIETLRSNGVYTVLISGGLRYFTEKAASQLRIDENHGNDLVLNNNVFTGEVIEPILNGPVKEQILQQTARKLNIDPSECLALGDGANDRYMVASAGCGIGFYPKERLRFVCDQVIDSGDLRSVLYAQGYTLTYDQVAMQ